MQLRLEGKLVTLEEIEPRFFPYVIKWRNDPNLNQYLNQPFALTLEKEQDWYESQYLKLRGGGRQGYLVGIERETGRPFGTLGWTNLDSDKRRCVIGRLLVAEKDRYQVPMLEMEFLLGSYLYQFTDEHFCHVVAENRRSIKIAKAIGFVENLEEIQYPEEILVNGMRQIEFRRTRDQFEKARSKYEAIF